MAASNPESGTGFIRLEDKIARLEGELEEHRTETTRTKIQFDKLKQEFAEEKQILLNSRDYKKYIELKEVELPLNPSEQALVTKVVAEVQRIKARDIEQIKPLETEIEFQTQQIRERADELNTLQIRKETLERELEDLKHDIRSLNTRIEYSAKRKDEPHTTSYSAAHLLRDIKRAERRVKILNHRIEVRERILAGQRVPLGEDSDTELSDGGHSDLDDIVYRFPQGYKVRRSEKRKDRLRSQEYYDQIDREKEQKYLEERRKEETAETKRTKERRRATDNYPIVRRVEAVVPNLEQPQEEQQEEIEDQVESEQSEEEFEDEYLEEGNEESDDEMAVRWNIKDLPRFSGEKNENPTTHVMEFEDFLTTIDTYPITDANVGEIVSKFKNTLKGKARKWYQNIRQGQEEIATVDAWNTMITAFKTKYNPVGSTVEEQIVAWKNMKWDPTKEALDDYAEKFEELSEALGIGEDNKAQTFLSSLPSMCYFLTQGANTIQGMVNNINKGKAHGCMMPFPTSTTTETTQQAAVPFMAASDRAVTFTGETVIKENLRKVKEALRSDNERIVGQLDTLASVVDEISRRVDRRGRDRDRSNDRRSRRDRSDSRSSNRSRTPSRDRNDRRGRRDRRDYSGDRKKRNGSGTRYKGNNKKVCPHCKKGGHDLPDCWQLQNELKKAGRKITMKQKPDDSDEEEDERAYMMQDINAVLSKYDLKAQSTNI